jgi:arylsulfatase A-like enzyme
VQVSSKQISRREFIRTTAYGVGSLPVVAHLAAADWGMKGPARPNVLFMMTDELTLKSMSACGNPYVRTPNMDSIAAGGVRFEKSYCTAPICSPSRSSLLTSRIPEVAGVRYNGIPVHLSIPNMGHVFRDAGYETAWTGKWHLGEYYPRGRSIPGFDYLGPIEHTGLGVDDDEPVADEAVGFLRRKHAAPFLLAVSFLNPHDICFWIKGVDVPVEEVGPDDLPPLPTNFEIDPDEPEFMRRCRERRYYGEEMIHTTSWDIGRWRRYLSAYYRLTERVDRAVGRVLSALREEGLEEDTVIVFTSDHGEGMAAHRWVVKLSLYEEPLTVPLIVSWKGVTPAGVSDGHHLVSGLDVLPTVCAYAGAPAPEGIQGISLRPLIENPELKGRDYVVSELRPDPHNRRMQGRMVRSHRYKYIAFTEGRRPEMLFDLELDPGETENLARAAGARDQLEEHRQLLTEWIAWADDRVVLPVLGGD